MTEKARSATRRKRHRKIVEEYCSYIIEIKDWELTYSHGLNSTPKLFPGQYSEHLDLSIKGIIRMHEKYSTKGVNLTFIGDREIFPLKNDSDFKPRCVGALTLRGDRRDFLGKLPFDSLPIIDSRMETKRIQFIDLNGLAPKYGHAYITWVHFFRNYDPNEY
ncbi:MAG TPA: hypothetical protein VLL97_08780 [Acidobacteriota bacterium]|nr:hypothetical protein [Acidobacteriota bacterium]